MAWFVSSRTKMHLISVGDVQFDLGCRCTLTNALTMYRWCIHVLATPKKIEALDLSLFSVNLFFYLFAGLLNTHLIFQEVLEPFAPEEHIFPRTDVVWLDVPRAAKKGDALRILVDYILTLFVGKSCIHHPTSQWYVRQAPIFWAYSSGIETLEPTLFCHDAGSCLPSASDQARVGTLTKWIWGLTCTLWSTNLGLIPTNNNEAFRRLASSKLLVSWLELDRPMSHLSKAAFNMNKRTPWMIHAPFYPSKRHNPVNSSVSHLKSEGQPV